MRGKASGPGVLSSLSGITPAYAGKSQWAGGLVVSIGDHPRICGEKPVGRGSCRLYRGSPPHMRGKGSFFNVLNCVIRITPAYAGKRLKRPMGDASAEDHPRICGEKACAGRNRSCEKGSPPHMRGKATVSRFIMMPMGITPAYAGKSITRLGEISLPKDHPRICGEKEPNVLINLSQSGSPPHMRGKANDALFAQLKQTGLTMQE